MLMRGRHRKLTATERSPRLKENSLSLWLIIFSLKFMPWKISKHGVYLTCAPCTRLFFQILFFKAAIKMTEKEKTMLLKRQQHNKEGKGWTWLEITAVAASRCSRPFSVAMQDVGWVSSPADSPHGSHDICCFLPENPSLRGLGFAVRGGSAPCPEGVRMAMAPQGGLLPLPILWNTGPWHRTPGAASPSARGCATHHTLVTPDSFTAFTSLTKVGCNPRGAIRICDLCKSL